jgi:hypothetical protein
VPAPSALHALTAGADPLLDAEEIACLCHEDPAISPYGPSMKVIGLTEFGGPEVLRILDLPDPEPGPSEVRIRVHTAGVNPTDSR